MAKVMILTKEGKNKAFEADNNGVQINIKHIAIGDGAYTPNEDMTQLQNEKMRVEILSKDLNPEAYQATLNVKFGTNDEDFYIKEYGVFLDDGTLFAVFSEENPESPTFKNKDNVLLMPIALNLLDSVNPDVINIIDNGADLKLTYTEEFAEINEHFNSLDTCCDEVKDQIVQLKSWTEQQIASSSLIVPPTVTVGEQNTLNITSSFQTNDTFRGTQDIAVAQAFSEAEHTQLIEEVVITNNFSQINFNSLPVDTNIFARVAVGSDKHLSNWTNIEFVSSSSYIEALTDFTVEGSPSEVPDNPELTINSLPNAVACTVDKVECRVMQGGNLVGSIIEVTDLTLPIMVEMPDLEVSTTYSFECRGVDTQKNIVGAWGSIEGTTLDTFSMKFDTLNDGSTIALWGFNDNLNDTGGVYDGVWGGTGSYIDTGLQPPYSGLGANFDEDKAIKGGDKGIPINNNEIKTVVIMFKYNNDSDDNTLFSSGKVDEGHARNALFVVNGKLSSNPTGGAATQTDMTISEELAVFNTVS